MASTSSINLMSSAIDVPTIVEGLIYADSAPVRNMQSEVTSLQSQVSAFQSLNSALSNLSDSVNTILYGSTTEPTVTPYTYSDRLADSVFSQCTVASSNDTAISATADNANSSGSYSITVSSLAQAQSMASSNFADTTSTQTGTGTLTITSGSAAPVTVTINSSNNTLSGVCDAINSANAGVTASIINDGTSNPYRILITANNSGTSNSFTVSDNLSGGQALGFQQVQAPTDAQFIINGVSVTKSSNTVSDIIPGVTFTLNALTTNPVTLSVSPDTDAIITALNNFVTAYNSVNSFMNSQFTYNTTTNTAGVLAGDSTLRNIQSDLQNVFTQSVTNRYTSYNIAAQVGLEFNEDGSLSLDQTQLQSALSTNATGVAALFLGDGTPAGGATASDSRVTYNGDTSATQAGTYDIQINGLAQQATVVGAQAVTTLSNNETLTITSGSGSAVVNLLQNDSLSTVLSKINTALTAQNMAVTATNDGTGEIEIATNGYGSSQTISVVSTSDGSAGTTGFGTSPAVANGADISGTINGDAATGNGLILTGASGQPEEGLSLSIAQTTTGSYGSVTVAPATQGVEGTSVLTSLNSILDGITDPLSGPIQSAEDSLNQSISNLNDDISSYQDRLNVESQQLTNEYNQADEALRLLTVTQASITSQLGSLPTTTT